MEDDPFRAVRELFFTEAAELHGVLDAGLLALAEDLDLGGVEGMLRAAHTLKGNAGSLGLTSLVELCHLFEELLVRVQEGAIPLTRGTLDMLRGGAAAIGEIIGGRGEPTLAGVQAHEGERSPGAQRHTLRTEVGRLDALLELALESSVAWSRMGELIRVAQVDPGVLSALARLHDDSAAPRERLEAAIVDLRLVPLAPSLEALGATVRDAARREEKEVDLVLDAGDLSLDTQLAEGLRAPLLHLCRNAVAHGIEAPERRRELHKDPRGRVTVRARRRPGGVVVEVEDDGGGLDTRRIRERAAALDIAGVAAMSDAEVHRLVLLPGFSTTDAVTATAGRGVGLDVVARDVAALHGTVALRSAKGSGTTVALHLPLTVALVRGLLIGEGDERFVVPFDAVLESLGAEGASHRGVAHRGGRAMPVVSLAALTGSRTRGDEGRPRLLVVEASRGEVGLLVGALKADRTFLVRPLPKAGGGWRGVSGVTVLGDGGVALVLDVASLVDGAAE